MNSLIELVKSVDQRILLLVAVATVIFVPLFIHAINKAVKRSHENKLKRNPFKLGSEHTGKYFKVSEVCDKLHVICLADNPSMEHPLGKAKKWFEITPIPKELREEGKVLLVNYKNGTVVCTRCPVF
jgi:hypothetical protein